MEYLLNITVVAAMSCVILSIGLAVYFRRHRSQRIGRAVSWMLIGEAVGMAVITLFATFELLGLLDSLTPLHATGIRWITIVCTAGSSIHLTYQLRKVMDE